MKKALFCLLFRKDRFRCDGKSPFPEIITNGQITSDFYKKKVHFAKVFSSMESWLQNGWNRSHTRLIKKSFSCIRWNRWNVVRLIVKLDFTKILKIRFDWKKKISWKFWRKSIASNCWERRILWIKFDFDKFFFPSGLRKKDPHIVWKALIS